MGCSLSITDTSRSPEARLHPVSLDRVQIAGGFWGPRYRRILEETVPSQYEQLEKSGVVDNFRNAAGGTGEFQGLRFNDTDAYKWIEAAALALAHSPNPRLRERLDSLIEIIGRTQGDDGYLDTFYSFGNEVDRWSDLGSKHEMYCAGHLIQAAVAHRRATGSDALFDPAKRFADHIAERFGSDRKPGTGGHPEIEMALVELYRETGAERYLELARFLVDQRGRVPLQGLPPKVIINHAPYRELTEIVGHAVRSLYLNCGAADIYLETGDQSLLNTLETLWKSMTRRRMYATGGVGSHVAWESFGEDYELPNTLAYSETCAAIASFMWNWRMLLHDPDSRFADLMELVLYNSMLSGISLDGLSYFYTNPLADVGRHRRSEWLRCACCPPNLARTLAALPGYLYSRSPEGLWVHLFVAGRADVAFADGRVLLEQKTGYPWSGDVELEISTTLQEPFGIHLRIPGWASSYAIHVDGAEINSPAAKGYVRIERSWQGKHRVALRMPLAVQVLQSHPHALCNTDRMALKRGPVVYCLEQVDNPDFHVWDIALDAQAQPEPEVRADAPDGAAVLRGSGRALDHGDFGERLYAPACETERAGRSSGRDVSFVAVPYYSWANREAGPMITWVRRLA